MKVGGDKNMYTTSKTHIISKLDKFVRKTFLYFEV